MTPETMINMDAWVIAFMAKNVITAGIIYKVVQVLVKHTKTKLDDDLLKVFKKDK